MDGREMACIVGLSFAGIYLLMMVLAAVGMGYAIRFPSVRRALPPL